MHIFFLYVVTGFRANLKDLGPGKGANFQNSQGAFLKMAGQRKVRENIL